MVLFNDYDGWPLGDGMSPCLPLQIATTFVCNIVKEKKMKGLNMLNVSKVQDKQEDISGSETD